jgi:hypothetical protein
MSPAAAQAILAENFAPWVQALGLTVEAVASDAAMLRLPFDPRLVRVGGTVCGQALMTAADTAMVIAVSAALGGFRPMATVGQTISSGRWPTTTCWWKRACCGSAAPSRSARSRCAQPGPGRSPRTPPPPTRSRRIADALPAWLPPSRRQ